MMVCILSLYKTVYLVIISCHSCVSRNQIICFWPIETQYIPIICICFTDNGTYCCPYCAQNFRYPHSLRAHMRFKCETLKKAMHMDTAPFRSSMEYRVPFSMYSQPTATVGNPKNISPSGSVYSQSTSSAGSAKDLSPSGSVTSTTSSLDSLSPPRYSSSPDVLSDGKHSHKRFRSGTDADTSGERFSNPSPGSQHASDDPDMRSAFRKVARHGSEPRVQPDVVSATSALIKSHQLGLLPSLPFNSVKASAIPPGIGSLPARFPLPITDPSLISPLSVARLHNANIPLGTAESNMKNAEYGRLNDKLMDIRNMENNNMYDKLSMLPQRRVGFCPSLFKSNNPMVDKIIHHNMHIPSSLTSFSLAQNWCAKCNTTFRMTSDLVYHMRSHHKQGFDPLKRKREEKLRCDVCGETFKERHHLSRHMTSHMWR